MYTPVLYVSALVTLHISGMRPSEGNLRKMTQRNDRCVCCGTRQRKADCRPPAFSQQTECCSHASLLLEYSRSCADWICIVSNECAFQIAPKNEHFVIIFSPPFCFVKFKPKLNYKMTDFRHYTPGLTHWQQLPFFMPHRTSEQWPNFSYHKASEDLKYSAGLIWTIFMTI